MIENTDDLVELMDYILPLLDEYEFRQKVWELTGDINKTPRTGRLEDALLLRGDSIISIDWLTQNDYKNTLNYVLSTNNTERAYVAATHRLSGKTQAILDKILELRRSMLLKYSLLERDFMPTYKAKYGGRLK